MNQKKSIKKYDKTNKDKFHKYYKSSIFRGKKCYRIIHSVISRYRYFTRFVLVSCHSARVSFIFHWTLKVISDNHMVNLYSVPQYFCWLSAAKNQRSCPADIRNRVSVSFAVQKTIRFIILWRYYLRSTTVGYLEKKRLSNSEMFYGARDVSMNGIVQKNIY